MMEGTATALGHSTVTKRFPEELLLKKGLQKRCAVKQDQKYKYCVRFRVLFVLHTPFLGFFFWVLTLRSGGKYL
jgi:hypothetical protein